MGRRWINLIFMGILCFSLISSSEILLVKSESNSLVTINDEQFIIQQVLGGFSNFFVGSFNASNGYWIELDLSSSSNNSYTVYLDVHSANNGTIFSGNGEIFSQTIFLDYKDVYNITIAKSPFYSTGMINGTIGVFHNETATQSPSGIWVEVARFIGDSPMLGDTEHFIIDHIEWRIRWEYAPRPNEEDLSVFQIYVETYEEFHKRVDSVLNWGSGVYTGTLYISDDYGQYFLMRLSNVPSYTIIVEQNIESIPEFPSWIILPLLLVGTLMITVYKKKLRQ